MKTIILSLVFLALPTWAASTHVCAPAAVAAAAKVEALNVHSDDIGENPTVELVSDKNGLLVFDVSLENASYEVQTKSNCTIVSIKLTRED
jgi:hypothetical protein